LPKAQKTPLIAPNLPTLFFISRNQSYICAVWILSKYKEEISYKYTMQLQYRTINDLRPYESSRAISFTDTALACKLTAMGLLPGTKVMLVRESPLGDAVYIKIDDGLRIALRKEEAASVRIEK
jgi:Fe2+ transport system protein FeoA